MRIIAGKYKNRRLLVPKEGTRPTLGAMREAIFNICQNTIEGARVLDLFAGTGAIGLEALSRGAHHVTFVEKSRVALSLLKQNIAELGVEGSVTIYPLDVFKALSQLEARAERFDFIYIDPPYGEGLGEKLLTRLDASSLLSQEGVLFLEESSLLQGPWRHLTCVSERRVGRSHLMQLSKESPEGQDKG